MSIGSVLVAFAVALIVVAYVVRPFHITRALGADVDRAIEAWVAQVRAEKWGKERQLEGVPGNCCPRCGRHIGPDDRFCAGCGARLPGGTR